MSIWSVVESNSSEVLSHSDLSFTHCSNNRNTVATRTSQLGTVAVSGLKVVKILVTFKRLVCVGGCGFDEGVEPPPLLERLNRQAERAYRPLYIQSISNKAPRALRQSQVRTVLLEAHTV